MTGERVGAAVRRLTARLEGIGVESARLDAELLVAHALRSDRSRLFLSPDRPLTPAQARALADLERRRAVDRESIAHLLGVRGFRYLDLEVDRRALIPRPETELLVEVGLELPEGATVVDVGTGSGAIALALAHERPDLTVHATDVSIDALEVARGNATRLGLTVTFHEGDLLAGAVPERSSSGDEPAAVDGSADARGTAGEGGIDGIGGMDGIPILAVLSNPPYIPDGERDALPPEVRDHDPHLALFGGADGLDVIRRLVPAARAAGAALIAIEVGEGQVPAVVELLHDAGFAETEVRDDLVGIGRVAVGRTAGARGAASSSWPSSNRSTLATLSVENVDRKDDEPAGVLPLDPSEIAELIRVTTAGGIALFPAEGVYGLAADPRCPDAVRRLATLKGRDPGKPSAILLWTLEDALDLVVGAGEDVLTAMGLLLPGPVGVLVPNPRRRFAAVLGADPTTIGVRVPALPEAVDASPIVQTSANRAGEPDAARVDDVPRSIREACALILDRGPRPGTPSTLVDLRGLATDDGWRIVREGAVPRKDVARALGGARAASDGS